MPQPLKQKAVYEDLFSLPENMTGEIIEGELVAAPRPSRRHAVAASALGYQIGPPYHFGAGGGPGGWIILHEPEIAFGEDILVPDLAGWKEERFPETEEQNWLSVAPDWVCEILSPNSVRIDRMQKMRTYATHKVTYAWLVDPLQMLLEVFRLEAGRWIVLGVHGESEKVRAEPFQEVELDLAALWIEMRRQRQAERA